MGVLSVNFRGLICIASLVLMLTQGAIANDFDDERQETAAATAAFDELLRYATENSNDVITIIEKDGIIRYQSPSVERIFGYKPREMIGKSIYEFKHPQEFSAITKEFTDFVKDKGSVGVLSEYRVKHKKGHWIYCETTKNNQLSNANIRGIIANTRDISERRNINQLIKVLSIIC